MKPSSRIALGLAACSLAFAAQALEYPIGSPQQMAGMEVAAVYLQAVEMEPEGHMRKAAESDVHLEADIHAMANNPNGFKEGDWIPYLMVKYELTKLPGGEVIKGDMMPMVANDGSHYGDNVKLKGPGKELVGVDIRNSAGALNLYGGTITDFLYGIRTSFIHGKTFSLPVSRRSEFL